MKNDIGVMCGDILFILPRDYHGASSDYRDVKARLRVCRWGEERLYVTDRGNWKQVTQSMPVDGKLVVWIKGCVEGDYVYGVKESDGYYHYEVRYDAEGPKNKELIKDLIEEGDWMYIQSLVHDGKLLEVEPNADKEIAKDHKYRAEIIRAIFVAKMCLAEENNYHAAIKQLEITRETAEKEIQIASKPLEVAKDSRFFRDAKVRKAEGDLEQVKQMWVGKIKIAEEAVARTKEARDKTEQKACEVLKCAQEHETKERAAKEARTKVQDLVSKIPVIVETLRKQMTTAKEDLGEIQRLTSTVRTAEVTEIIKNAVATEAEIRRQFDIALNSNEEASRRAEKLLRANPLDVEIDESVDIAIQVAEEAEEAHAIVLAAGKEVDKQYLAITEAKKKIALAQTERANKSAKEVQEYIAKASQLFKAIQEQKNKADTVVSRVKHFSGINVEIVNAANAVIAEIEKQLGLASASVEEITKQATIAADAAKKATEQVNGDSTAIAETTKQAGIASQAVLEAKKQLELSTITINAVLEAVKKEVVLALEIEERTKKEAKTQEDKVRQIVTETKDYVESAIALLKPLREKMDVVTSIITEIETLIDIYAAEAARTKRQADVDLTVKLKLQLKTAAPMIDEVKKRIAEALPLEEEINKQIKIANDILQKTEKIRQANPIAVDEITAQVDPANKALTEIKRLQDAVSKLLEKTKEHVVHAQNALAEARQDVQDNEVITGKAPGVSTEKPISWLSIPESFICPITNELMVDPVMAADRKTYERKAIEKWLFEYNKRISPLTGERLDHTMLQPNDTLKQAIDEFQKQLPEMQRLQIEKERKRLEDTNFRVAIKVREEEIKEHLDIIEVKQKVHDEERREQQEQIAKLSTENETLKEKISTKEKNLEEKTHALTQAEDTITIIREEQESFAKKLEQALSKNNTKLVEMCQTRLNDLKQQLEATEHEKQGIEEERKTLESERKALTEQNQKLLGAINTKIDSIKGEVHEVKERLVEKLQLERENEGRQERILKALDEKLQEVQKVGGRTPEQEALLSNLLTAKNAETLKAQKRTQLFTQKDYPQLKDFYLSLQLLFNRLLVTDEVAATGAFATQDTTKKEKAASIIMTCAKLVPVVGHAITAACVLTKLYADKCKQEKAGSAVADLPPDILSREAMVEEIAFGLCERYEDQLKALNAGADAEKQTAVSKLVDTAIQRMHAYLQAEETLEPDPVIALINAVRLTKIRGDRKTKIINKPAGISAAAASSSTASTLIPNHWTTHGFFSQTGIRTTTPRRRRFDAEAPRPEDTNKKHMHYTDVQCYGYANGTENDARTAGMELRT